MVAPQEWKSYEDVARHLLEQFGSHFGLGRVEGKQLVSGASGTEWEIDAKGVRTDGARILIVECRRYVRSRLSQEDVGALAFRISDIRADGAILVSPLDLQAGAKLVAKSANIQHVILRPDSTTTGYLMKHLNTIFAGVSDSCAISVTDSATLRVIRADGSVEERTAGGDGT